jgi:hypothetical protein
MEEIWLNRRRVDHTVSVRSVRSLLARTRHTARDLRYTALDASSVRRQLPEIWREHNGIKHVAGPSGWPFRSPWTNYDLLTRCGCHVVLLMRRNALQRVVSEEIGRQSDIWHFYSESDRQARASFPFEPISVSRLRDQLQTGEEYLESCRSRLRSAGAHYHEVAYEDIFCDGAGVGMAAAIDQILRFLELPTLEDLGLRHRLPELLAAASIATDSPTVYRKIPNIDQVEVELGSDETGWLFR